MNRIRFGIAMLLLAGVLAACSAGGVSQGSTQGGGASSSGFRSNRAATPLTPVAKLALGTMKLEGTQQAVDAATAAKLIPLWQLMVQLNSSSSTAPQEVSAVTDAIKAAMAPAQLQAINEMKLSSADIATAFQAEGQSSGAGAAARGNGGAFVFSGGGPGNGGNRGFVVTGGPEGPGGFGGGGFGGGGAARTNGASTGTQTSSSLTAAQAAQARENAISTLVINQLVRLLQTKAGR